MSKTSGPSRIPTFGSKIPQAKLKSTSGLEAISKKDIGKKVRVIEKEGTLRYVGNVHFSNGVWCGVELSDALGKNDGVVSGIRYFVCPQNCGLMAPLAKVALLVNSNNENFEDDEISGPYSKLFVDDKLADKDSSTVVKYNNDNVENSGENIDQTVVVIKKSLVNPHNFTEIAEKILNETFGGEIKRRRTSKFESPTLRNNDSFSKPSSLPQLKSYNYSSTLTPGANKISNSAPIRLDYDDRKLNITCFMNNTLDDDSSKRDSLEFEESLGILTPEQMVDGMSLIESGDFKLELDERLKKNLSKTELQDDSALTQSKLSNTLDNKEEIKSDLPSPSAVDHSVTDFSLGIIDEQILANLTLKTDTTMNMELPLDTNAATLRLEQTPSPEDLPLDPTPIIESKPESTKSKTTNSFINSITSITSLDTGYQGDGEMSRPASRGADISPLTRRPLPRPQPRRADPMTDSDFYTESDADNHEENPRGDRKAQVIDGTLYGVDAQGAADIYVNNRENMDSSGIFTDIDSNPRTEEDSISNQIIIADNSPSDTSTKTISGNSQNNLQEILEKSFTSKPDEKKDNPKKRNASSPVISSPTNRSPRHANKDDKKYKMPKRDVVSKVKAMMEPNNQQHVNEKKSIKKPVNRWDAVMNKISRTDSSKTNLKEVKSKVFNKVSGTTPITLQRQTESKVQTNRQILTQKLQNVKTRRVRPRAVSSKNGGSSVHSSISDLSASVLSPKKIPGSSKREVVQVTQVLTASKLSPKTPPQNGIENKKITPQPSFVDVKHKKALFSPKEKKQPASAPPKESGRGTLKGGRASPVVRPPPNSRALAKPVPKVAEALAVLVQHLVFNVEAYQVPTLKREVQKFRLEAEQIRLACQQVEETLAEERSKQVKVLQEERAIHEKQISELIQKHQSEVLELNNLRYELEQRLTEENTASKKQLAQQNEEKLMTLKREFDKLQKTHEESLDILREENDSIREQIDEKNEQIEHIKHESLKLKEDYETKEMKLKEQLHNISKENHRLKQELSKIEEKMKHEVQAMNEENARLREENDRLLSYDDNKGISIQEVQSLRAVLDLKQKEVAELRRTLAEATQRNEVLSGIGEKASALHARCEDLQLQLQRKCEFEKNLQAENKRLHESFKDEINQKKRICQYNEELQWKLKQNREVVAKVLEQTAVEDSAFTRSLLSSSFNERHTPFRGLERAFSFREPRSVSKKSKNSCDSDDMSPPSSPKVKGVVEKSDSVSYVLDMEESPEVVASRIVRRSFRNSTPPKNTPTKSPSNKRPRMKNNPLSLSASANSVLPTNNNNNNKIDYVRSRSVSARNNGEMEFYSWTSTPISGKRGVRGTDEDNCDSFDSTVKIDLDLDDDNEVDLTLPALPSEMGRKKGSVNQALPSPKHLAGEAMISESNSEDESTSSSSVQL